MKYVIVVDYQNDFVTGALRNEEAIKILPNVKKVVESAAPGTGAQLIFTRDTHKADYLECKDSTEGKYLPVPHCIEGTDGHKIVNEIAEIPFVKELAEKMPWHFVDKPTFGFTGWDKVIGEDADEIIWWGVCTDICVISKELDDKALSTKATHKVIANACAGLTPEKHAAALSVMESCQIEVEEI